MSNIMDVIQADKNLASMLRSLKAAGLESELGKEGPYTVFAPSEIAFGNLHEGELINWLQPVNKVKLIRMLNNHVVEGKFNFENLFDGQKLKTMNDSVLEIKVNDGNITVNGAKLQRHNNKASNGVVHSLDAILSLN